MAKEVDEFLQELNGGQTTDEFASKDENVDLFGEATAKQEEEPNEEVEEKNLPFHKDPKIQRYVQREIAKALEGQSPKQVTTATDSIQAAETEDELVAAFTQIIGNDTPEKQHALRMLERGLKNIEEKALSGQRQLEAERQAQEEAEREVERGFESIEESFEVDITSKTPQATKLRSEFIDFIETIAPKDSRGNVKEYPDFEKSFEIFQKMQEKQNPSNSRAKELAARSMARSSDASSPMKPNGTTWNDIERFFSKLEDK